MAFSAQTDHGQNERKESVLAEIEKDSRKEKSKFVPNPAAKPFVPSVNLKGNFSCSNKVRTSADSQTPSQNGYISLKARRSGDQLTITAPRSFVSGPNSLPSILHGISPAGGDEQPHTPTTPQKHIALHLLSKLLDDESINNTSVDESSGGLEPFPGMPTFVQDQGQNLSSQSWPGKMSVKQPLTETPPNGINVITNFGSFPGQNIWAADSQHNNSPPLSPLDLSPSSLGSSSLENTPMFHHKHIAHTKKSSPHNSTTDSSGTSSPVVNGYADDVSPYSSPTDQSLGSFGAPSPSVFVPVQKPFPLTNGITRHQHSFESGYLSTSNNGHQPQSQASPSSNMGFMIASSPKLHASYTLPFSEVGSYNSSPSMSPSSPPANYDKFIRRDNSHDPGKGNHSSRKESVPQSPSLRDGHLKEPSYQNHVCVRNRSPLTTELHVSLEECYEQLRLLEKDRRKAEAEISYLWNGRRLSNPGNSINLRLPPNPSRVDKLIVDQFREQAKVEALVSRIERIRHSPLHISISESVDQWQVAIRELQTRRREEISSGNSRNRHLSCSPRYSESSDLFSLVSAIKKLSTQTRVTRTTIWCAVQLVTASGLQRTCSQSSSEASKEKDGSSGVS